MKKEKLSDLGEFGLIERIKNYIGVPVPPNVLGIGDDCAVIPQTADRSLLITTDLLVEGVHFLISAISARDLGYKSLAVNISDIAAMGGSPTAAFLSLALPLDLELQWIDEFFEGFKELAQNHNVSLLGGDTTKSLNSIVINITLLGEAHPQKIKLRSTAQPGDSICVTNTLGDSAGGLKLILGNLPQNSETSRYLLKRHHRPAVSVKEALWLAQHAEVHAMMDVSDGIASDLQRIMGQSGCGAHIHLENIPISSQLGLAEKQWGWNALELAAAGGEDYCLLVTVAKSAAEKVVAAFEAQFGTPLYIIGEITQNPLNLKYTFNGKDHSSPQSGFDHFKTPSVKR